MNLQTHRRCSRIQLQLSRAVRCLRKAASSLKVLPWECQSSPRGLLQSRANAQVQLWSLPVPGHVCLMLGRCMQRRHLQPRIGLTIPVPVARADVPVPIVVTGVGPADLEGATYSVQEVQLHLTLSGHVHKQKTLPLLWALYGASLGLLMQAGSCRNVSNDEWGGKKPCYTPGSCHCPLHWPPQDSHSCRA